MVGACVDCYAINTVPPLATVATLGPGWMCTHYSAGVMLQPSPAVPGTMATVSHVTGHYITCWRHEHISVYDKCEKYIIYNTSKASYFYFACCAFSALTTIFCSSMRKARMILQSRRQHASLLLCARVHARTHTHTHTHTHTLIPLSQTLVASRATICSGDGLLWMRQFLQLDGSNSWKLEG